MCYEVAMPFFQMQMLGLNPDLDKLREAMMEEIEKLKKLMERRD